MKKRIEWAGLLGSAQAAALGAPGLLLCDLPSQKEQGPTEKHVEALRSMGCL